MAYRRHPLGPNWFAAVMGTGIVANAAVLLPYRSGPLHAFAVGVWLLAAVLLAGLSATAAIRPRTQLRDPSLAPFYGAPPMAMLTVGSGALLAGQDLIGAHAALVVAMTLWILGTVTGLVVAAVVPYLMFNHLPLRPQDTLATWLMPVVPPMVSAATGAALVPHLPPGQAQLTLLLAGYAMFGLSLLASLIVITLVWARLLYHPPGPAATVPTMWIVLGPLGQSITAANLLGTAADGVTPYASALHAFGVVYGVPAWGFAMLWLMIAAATTLRTLRRGLPFSLTWWSFTFPVGTCVTGTAQLALHTGADAFAGCAVGLYVLLLGAWATALVHTLRGTVSGRLLVPVPAPVGSTR